MWGKVMYRIELKYEGNLIKIKMNQRISVLSDDSGVGKTYVAKAVDSALKVKKYNSIEATCNGENCNIHVVFEDTSDKEIDMIISKSNSIIIIDEADKIFGGNNHLVKKMLKNESSAFLLILRGDPKDLILTPKQYLTFRYKQKCIEIYPFESKVNNFFVEG